ncbi:MAG: hypothetical protein VW686_11745, partial [Luminiphilus sp.]
GYGTKSIKKFRRKIDARAGLIHRETFAEWIDTRSLGQIGPQRASAEDHTRFSSGSLAND